VQIKIDENTSVEIPSFFDMPLVGVKEIPGHAYLLVTDDEGRITRVFSKRHFPGSDRLLEMLYEKSPDCFNLARERYGVYGCNSSGEVVFGCCVADAEPDSKNILERLPHLKVELLKATQV